MTTQAEAHQAVSDAFASGTIVSTDTKSLHAHLLALSNQDVANNTIQHREIIRGMTINNLLLQRHIDRIDTQNTRTQWLVIILAVASLIGTGVQIYLAFPARS